MAQSTTVAAVPTREALSVSARQTETVASRASAGAERNALPQWRRTSVPVALLLGFVAGSVFWHFVGFWDFVGRVVFHKPRAPAAISGPLRTGDLGTKAPEQLAATTMITSDVEQVGLAQTDVEAMLAPIPVPAVAACTTLVRDAVTAQTVAVPCPPGSVPTRFGVALRRGDFARLTDADRARTADRSADAASAGTPAATWSTVTSRAP